MDVQQVHKPKETIEVDVPLIKQLKQRTEGTHIYVLLIQQLEQRTLGGCFIDTTAQKTSQVDVQQV
jgi:hypothetical protein